MDTPFPLHAAIATSNVDITSFLLQEEPHLLNTLDDNHHTPIYVASQIGNLTIFKFVLDLKPDVRIVTNNGWTPLHRAVHEGHKDIVKLLLDYDRSLLNSIDFHEWSPLTIASYTNNAAMVTYLLAEGAKNDIGKSAEEVAEENGFDDMAQMLRRLSIKTGSPYDVMLSYQWDSQKEVLVLKSFLEKNGLSVWIDVTKMHGNIFTRMQEGITQSKVILLCITEKYELSQNCKTEYNYVKKMNKPVIPVKFENYDPKNELDIILGNELYYTFYVKETREKVMGDILEAVQRKLKLT